MKTSSRAPLVLGWVLATWVLVWSLDAALQLPVVAELGIGLVSAALLLLLDRVVTRRPGSAGVATTSTTGPRDRHGAARHVIPERSDLPRDRRGREHRTRR